MIVRDWRGFDRADMDRLYRREHEHWVRHLAWDASSSWKEIEQARITWGLPGYIVIDDDGAPRGWTYCFPEDGTVHIGGIVADSPAATQSLIDAAVELGESFGPARTHCFVLDRAAGLAQALAGRGFAVERYQYLACEPAHGPAASVGDAWRDEDVPAAAHLLRECYGAAGAHFAPDNTPAQWERYVRGLVEQPGCGVFDPRLTRVVRDSGAVTALVLVTRIGPATAHLAQVAVHPSHQGRGVARRLVIEACELAQTNGARQVTLLVGEQNHIAGSLYRGLGFDIKAGFVAGLREASVI